MIINNKMKQHAQGNWGSNKWAKEHTEVVVPDDVEIVRHKKVKRSKKERMITVFSRDMCPFCRKELPDDLEAMKKVENKWRWRIWHVKVNKCSCGAFEVDDCPACKRTTWYNPVTQIFKHQDQLGCGFEGVKKYV